MYKGKSILGVIPARAGSKRLANKHLLDFNGKPLMEHCINETQRSKYLDEVIVSSDCDKILALASKANVTALTRPAEFATDEAKTYGFMKHAIDSAQKQHDYVILLQPTSPLRLASHIDESIEMIIDKEAHSVISVARANPSPLWANTLPEDLSMDNFISAEIANTRGQDLPVYYRLNGAIYISKVEEFIRHQGFYQTQKTYAYIMPEENSIDIDTAIDLELARIVHKQMSSKPLFITKNLKEALNTPMP